MISSIIIIIIIIVIIIISSSSSTVPSAAPAFALRGEGRGVPGRAGTYASLCIYIYIYIYIYMCSGGRTVLCDSEESCGPDWVFITAGCSGRRVQWIGVELL